MAARAALVAVVAQYFLARVPGVPELLDKEAPEVMAFPLSKIQKLNFRLITF
jgi:hypothetical protein